MQATTKNRDPRVRGVGEMDNRRLVGRVRPDELTILWCTPGTKLGHRRERKRPPVARVIDISHTGMQVVARAADGIQRGTVLDIVLEGIVTPVRVRWIGPTTVEGVLSYGVELLQITVEVETAVQRILAECYERDGIELPDAPAERRTIW